MFEKGARWSEAWDNNPRIARLDEHGDFQQLAARVNYLRPYMQAKTRERWTWKEYGPLPGELYFTEAEREFGKRYAGRIVVEPHIKPGASPNKSWPWVNWNKFAYLAQRAGLMVTQLGPHGTRLLMGADFVPTSSMRLAAAVLAEARAAVLHEGGAHHACAAVGTKAVVIYGGFISPAVTGYADQINLFTGDGLGCGMRVRCECCARAMAKITPEAVLDHLQGVLNDREGTDRGVAENAA